VTVTVAAEQLRDVKSTRTELASRKLFSPGEKFCCYLTLNFRRIETVRIAIAFMSGVI
jgi:hypothetical protein